MEEDKSQLNKLIAQAKKVKIPLQPKNAQAILNLIYKSGKSDCEEVNAYVKKTIGKGSQDNLFKLLKLIYPEQISIQKKPLTKQNVQFILLDIKEHYYEKYYTQKQAWIKIIVKILKNQNCLSLIEDFQMEPQNQESIVKKIQSQFNNLQKSEKMEKNIQILEIIQNLIGQQQYNKISKTQSQSQIQVSFKPQVEKIFNRIIAYLDEKWCFSLSASNKIIFKQCKNEQYLDLIEEFTMDKEQQDQIIKQIKKINQLFIHSSKKASIIKIIQQLICQSEKKNIIQKIDGKTDQNANQQAQYNEKAKKKLYQKQEQNPIKKKQFNNQNNLQKHIRERSNLLTNKQPENQKDQISTPLIRQTQKKISIGNNSEIFNRQITPPRNGNEIIKIEKELQDIKQTQKINIKNSNKVLIKQSQIVREKMEEGKDKNFKGVENQNNYYKSSNQSNLDQSLIPFDYNPQKLSSSRQFLLTFTIIEKDPIISLKLYYNNDKSNEIPIQKQFKSCQHNSKHYYNFRYITPNLYECVLTICYQVKYLKLLSKNVEQQIIINEKNKCQREQFYYFYQGIENFKQIPNEVMNFCIIYTMLLTCDSIILRKKVSQNRVSDEKGFSQNQAHLHLLFKWLNAFQTKFITEKFIKQSQNKIKFRDCHQNNKKDLLKKFTLKIFLYFGYSLYKQVFAIQLDTYFNLFCFQYPYDYNSPCKYISVAHKKLEEGYVQLMLYLEMNKNSEKNYSLQILKKLFISNLEFKNNQKFIKKEIIQKLKKKKQILELKTLNPFLISNKKIGSSLYLNIVTNIIQLPINQNSENQTTIIFEILNQIYQKTLYQSKHNQINQTQEVQINDQGFKNLFTFNISTYNKNKYISQKKFRVRYENFSIFEALLNKIMLLNNLIPLKILKNFKKQYFEAAKQSLLNSKFTNILIFYQGPLVQINEEIILNILKEYKLSNQSIKNILMAFLTFQFENNTEKINSIIFSVIDQVKQQFALIAYIFNEAFNYIKLKQDQKKILELFQKCLKKISFTNCDREANLLDAFKLQPRIKQLYLDQYCSYLKNNNDDNQLNIVYSIIKSKNPEQRILDELIERLCQNPNIDPQTRKKQIWQHLKANPRQLFTFQFKYKKSFFHQSLSSICSEILEKKITKKDLYYLNENIKQIQEVLKKDTLQKIKIKQAICTVKSQLEQIQNRIKDLKNIFQTHFKENKEQLYKELQLELEKAQTSIQHDNIQISIKIPQKISQTYSLSKQIIILIDSVAWQKQNIHQLSDFTAQIDKVKIKIKQKIDQFCDKKITLKEFNNFFPKSKIKKTLKLIGCSHQIIKSIEQSKEKIYEQNLQKISQKINALCFIVKKIQNKQLPIQKWENFLTSKNQDQNIKLQQCLKIIQETEKILKINQFDRIKQKNQIFKVIINSQKSQEVLQFIQNYKIDEKSIEDLKQQYFNDTQSQLLKYQDILQFQKVVTYWNTTKKSENFIEYMHKLKGLLQQKGWEELPKNIQNCQGYLGQLTSRIRQLSKGGEISFKQQVQNIFKRSLFSLEIKNNNVEINIQIEININSKQEKQKQIQEKRKETISFKKLESFKQKFQLLITSFEKEKNSPSVIQNNNQQQNNTQQDILNFQNKPLIKNEITKSVDLSLQNKILLVDKYSDFYDCVKQIFDSCKNLVKYGYDPTQLKKQEIIYNSDYNCLKEFSIQLKGICSVWVEKVKQYYKQSFLQTHFVGTQLNNFIKSSLEEQYLPQFKQIIGLTQLQFQKHLQSQEIKNILKFNKSENLIPLEKFKKVSEMYKIIQKNKQPILLNNQRKVILITCDPQRFYPCIKSQQENPLINHILYCQFDFIDKNNIQGVSKAIKQYPFRQVPIQQIADFYQLTQIITFKQVEQSLQNYYKKPLDEQEKEMIKKLKQKMSKKSNQFIPNLYDFQVALFRLASRILPLKDQAENQNIFEFIEFNESLWPKNLKLELLKNDEDFVKTLKCINLSKIGPILKIIQYPVLEEMKFAISQSNRGYTNAKTLSNRNQPQRPPKSGHSNNSQNRIDRMDQRVNNKRQLR